MIEVYYKLVELQTLYRCEPNFKLVLSVKNIEERVTCSVAFFLLVFAAVFLVAKTKNYCEV